jgi:hypothetical protein
LIAVCAALLTTACGFAPSARPDVELHARFDAPPLPSVDVRLRLQPEHGRDADRYIRAAFSTLKTCGEWLGPFPRESLTLLDPAWHAAPAAGGDAIVLERAPWWSTPTAMAPELSTARAVSRRFLSEAIDTLGLPGWFVDGLAEYVARRAVTPLFEVDNLSPGYAFLEERYFHAFVPRFVRVRLRVEADGGPIPAYRARQAVRVVPQAGSADEAQSLAGKAVLALGTLERWLGRPVFDAVVAEFVRSSRGSRPSLAEFERIASATSGQDLSWFFDQAFRSSAAFDYGVETLTSERDQGEVYVTTVTARRYGDAQFTGTSVPPIGPFESGRGITLLVIFADGQRRIDYWDGRGREKTFRYRSPARAVSAAIDPGGIVLLDLKQSNNSRALASNGGAAANRWAGRYLLWLEDLLLSYGSLV